MLLVVAAPVTAFCLNDKKTLKRNRDDNIYLLQKAGEVVWFGFF